MMAMITAPVGLLLFNRRAHRARALDKRLSGRPCRIIGICLALPFFFSFVPALSLGASQEDEAVAS